MTSQTFHVGDINEIKVPPDRQRKELKDLPILADSIKRLGLINPITVTRELVLVAGERRLAACRSLAWSTIPYQFTDEIDPHGLRAIELEENVKRVDLDWRDLCLAIADYHSFRSSEGPWSEERTAAALGLDQSTVNSKLRIATELRAGNVRVVEAPKLSTARTIVRREASRATATALEAIRTPEGAAPAAQALETPIILADFHEWAGAYTGPRFNFIHCDFPYGINMQNSEQSATQVKYDDYPATFFDLLDCLSANIKRLADDSCHIMFWFHMKYYLDTLATLEGAGFWVDPVPLVWHTGGEGIASDPLRRPRYTYQTALYGARGDRKIVQVKNNVISHPTERETRVHQSQKPLAVLTHFFQLFVDGHSRVLDPTCGSGTSLAAARRLGAASCCGIEIDPDNVKLAQEAYARD